MKSPDKLLGALTPIAPAPLTHRVTVLQRFPVNTVGRKLPPNVFLFTIDPIEQNQQIFPAWLPLSVEVHQRPEGAEVDGKSSEQAQQRRFHGRAQMSNSGLDASPDNPFHQCDGHVERRLTGSVCLLVAAINASIRANLFGNAKA